MAEPIAYVLAGGNAKPNAAAGMNRIADYAALAKTMGPRLKAAGMTRVLIHNPGGIYALGYAPDPDKFYGPAYDDAWKRGLWAAEMVPNQWQLAEMIRAPYASRVKLKEMAATLASFGVKEIIFYVGSPLMLADAEKEGPALVAPFTDCAQPGLTIGLGFDGVGAASSVPQVRIWKEADDVCRLFDALRLKGHKVYVEPRLNKAQLDAGLGKHIDGTIAEASYDRQQGFDLTIQPGDVLQIPEPNVTPILRDSLNWEK